MSELKTSEPTPVSILHHDENSRTEVYLLDEGDRMAWNQSTNYDRYMVGPSLVFKKVSSSGMEISEYYVNQEEPWEWLNFLLQLGISKLSELDNEEIREFRNKCDEDREEYQPHVSHFKNRGE